MAHAVFYLTSLPFKAKAQMASGQGSHWLIESPTKKQCSSPIQEGMLGDNDGSRNYTEKILW